MNLEDTRPFEVLLYVWGDARGKKTAPCSNHDSISQLKKSTLLVTVNFWHALRRFRLEDKTKNSGSMLYVSISIDTE